MLRGLGGWVKWGRMLLLLWFCLESTPTALILLPYKEKKEERNKGKKKPNEGGCEKIKGRKEKKGGTGQVVLPQSQTDMQSLR